MSRLTELQTENEALRARISQLSEAGLRINASLDLATVQQGVLDSARQLSSARYGLLLARSDSGEESALFASGFSAEGDSELQALRGQHRLWDQLNEISGPVRGDDVHAFGLSRDFAETARRGRRSEVMAFMAAPISYRDEHIAAVLVWVPDQDEAFTHHNEQTLELFCSQAAVSIANARRYKSEARARADLETLINTSPVGVVVFDAKSRSPVSFNQEIVRILDGLRDPDAPPRDLLPVLTVQRGDGREYTIEELFTAETAGGASAVRAEEIVLRVPDGRNATVLMNATPIYSSEGESESVVVTLQDMSPLREHERLRSDFLAIVSHELRAPLAAAKGSVATLLDKAMPLDRSETTHFYRIIDAQIDRMRLLISDLLDVARIDTGALAVHPEPTDIEVLIDEARTAYRSSGARHVVNVQVAPGLRWIMADRPRLVQVLINLLTNAARHSPESTPIRVSAEQDELHAMVSVSDEGRGIPADSLPNLFVKYSRVDGQDHRGDTGLGLAICKGIVEAHGGRIWAESEGPGLGSRFNFTIPTVGDDVYITSAARTTASDDAESPLTARDRTRVLVVDDDPLALRHAQDALLKSGFEPIATSDPADAVRLVMEADPKLALLDFVLPGTNGIELMNEIHESRYMPVVFLSAYGQEDMVARAFDSGATDYVVKPFSATELVSRIRAALRKSDGQHKLADPYRHADLEIDYVERRVTLAGQEVRLRAIEYRLLAELSANAGRVVTYLHLLTRVWGIGGMSDLRPMRTVMSTLRSRLNDDAADPTYLFTEPRVGYRMPAADKRRTGDALA